MAHLKGANYTDSYRAGYDCSKMKDATVNRRATALFDTKKVKARIEHERKSTLRRNHATLDEVLNIMADALRVDPLDMLDNEGKLKAFKDMPKGLRRAVSSFEVSDVLFMGESVGTVQKVKFVDKARIMEMFLKVFGAYLEKPADTGAPRPILEGGRELPQ